MMKSLRGPVEITPLDLSLRKRNDRNSSVPAIKDKMCKKKQRIKYTVSRNHSPINPDYLELLDAEFEKYPLKTKNEIEKLAAHLKLPRRVVEPRFSNWRHQMKKSKSDRLNFTAGQNKGIPNNIQNTENYVSSTALGVSVTGSRNLMSDPKVQTILYVKNLKEFGFQVQVESDISSTNNDKDISWISKSIQNCINHSMISECTKSERKGTRFEDDKSFPNHPVVAENLNSEEDMTLFGNNEKLVIECEEKNLCRYMIDESLMSRANIRIKFKRIE